MVTAYRPSLRQITQCTLPYLLISFGVHRQYRQLPGFHRFCQQPVGHHLLHRLVTARALRIIKHQQQTVVLCPRLRQRPLASARQEIHKIRCHISRTVPANQVKAEFQRTLPRLVYIFAFQHPLQEQGIQGLIMVRRIRVIQVVLHHLQEHLPRMLLHFQPFAEAVQTAFYLLPRERPVSQYGHVIRSTLFRHVPVIHQCRICEIKVIPVVRHEIRFPFVRLGEHGGDFRERELGFRDGLRVFYRYGSFLLFSLGRISTGRKQQNHSYP